MSINTSNARNLLRNFNFKKLFIEELGWDHHHSSHGIEIENKSIFFISIAEKRGVQIFVCESPDEYAFPKYIERKRLDKAITQIAYEHLVIFYDKAKTTQVWQWVNRQPGQAAAYREYRFDQSHSFESLIQKLDTICFNLKDEESLSLSLVTSRLKDALDRDRVTTRFYDFFRKEKDIFLRFIEGIENNADLEWYGSIMLNRLMFVYFIQKKGFLVDDRNYLRNHFKIIKKKFGKNKFQAFYRHFLLRLFHEGLNAKPPRGHELDDLLGEVPYLNGGLFQIHGLEQRYKINIPDEAFERIFNFFDQYEWHLDERPLSAGNEINPDVLGYIFEKYINQKEMGAYYTKEDITEYIAKNTIISLIFNRLREDYKLCFSQGKHCIWNHLPEDPNKYIYNAVKYGCSFKIPEIIENQNSPADPKYALETETWSETIERRQYYESIRARISKGEILSINDFITYNLDIRQFTQDAIENTEDPEFLLSLFKTISNLTILDPTVGSGAFLFAALNILEPLYEACLDRMQAFIDDTSISEYQSQASEFKQYLAHVSKHLNRRYFIYKSIIIKNLYGIDLVDEAVEICKLRLFLKLVSQVEHKDQIEPLPDIDFNICSGNSLVGFASIEEITKSMKNGKLDFDNSIVELEERVKQVDRDFREFRSIQVEYRDEEIQGQKQKLQHSLSALEDTSNHYLAKEYGIDWKDSEKYLKWLDSHLPFHWFIGFYGILQKGGFDVIIGNPPYVEYSKVKKDYTLLSDLFKTESSNNLYAFIFERSISLSHSDSRIGLIVPISLTCTKRMQTILELILLNIDHGWFSNYAERPSKLFTGAEVLLTISILGKRQSEKKQLYSTKLRKWHSDYRQNLFQYLRYAPVQNRIRSYLLPKISSPIENGIVEKVFIGHKKLGAFLLKDSDHHLYYRIGGGRYWKVFTNFQPKFILNGKPSVSSRENYLYFKCSEHRDITIASLSSSLFFWYFMLTTNGRDLNPFDLREFPLDLINMEKSVREKLVALCEELMDDYHRNKILKHKISSLTGSIHYEEFYPRKSVHILNRIDEVLSDHFKFSRNELEFILNYDFKYRMGIENLN